MIDLDKLRSDIESAQRNMSSAMAHAFDAIACTIQAIDNDKHTDAPAWKPEDLIGKLVRGQINLTSGDPAYIDGIPVFSSLHGDHMEISSIPIHDPRPLTEAEALALVYRPKPKTRYDWSKAPEWANWAVTDEKGLPWWSDAEPVLNSSKTYWISKHKSTAMWTGYILDPSGDWRDSLERKPA